jgi:hypothetical protein
VKKVRAGKHTTVSVLDSPNSIFTPNQYSIGYSIQDEYVELSHITFQTGHPDEKGVNGVTNEDLLAIVIDRTQAGKGREKAIAVMKMQEALMWLEKHAADREKRGVEGKSIV